MESLTNYAGLCIDRRQDMLNEYLRTYQSEGRLEGDIVAIYQQYPPKSTIGQNMGSWYSRGPSMRGMARDDRESARGRSSLELDEPNCFPTCITLRFPEANSPALERYTAHVDLWRHAVSECYAIDMNGANRILLRSLYGYPKPGIGSGEATSAMPLFGRIYQNGKRATGVICGKRPGRAGHFQHMGGTNPWATAIFYVMSDNENEIMTRFHPFLINAQPRRGTAQ